MQTLTIEVAANPSATEFRLNNKLLMEITRPNCLCYSVQWSPDIYPHDDWGICEEYNEAYNSATNQIRNEFAKYGIKHVNFAR